MSWYKAINPQRYISLVSLLTCEFFENKLLKLWLNQLLNAFFFSFLNHRSMWIKRIIDSEKTMNFSSQTLKSRLDSQVLRSRNIWSKTFQLGFLNTSYSSYTNGKPTFKGSSVIDKKTRKPGFYQPLFKCN